jgi:hypothetical protein
MSLKDTIARRPLLAALGGVVGLGVIGGGIYEARLVSRYSGHHGYSDLLAQLNDPDDANRLGAKVLDEAEVFEPQVVAGELRRRFKGQDLAEVLADDAVQGRIVETGGWVLPESLALLCGLAAKTG